MSEGHICSKMSLGTGVVEVNLTTMNIQSDAYMILQDVYML